MQNSSGANCENGSVILLLVISAFAVSPATAASKQKSKQTTEAEEIAKQHDNRALHDGLPLILPTWSLPIYFNMNKDEKSDKTEKTAKKTK